LHSGVELQHERAMAKEGLMPTKPSAISLKPAIRKLVSRTG
jgi:hypothetical protein